jgi:hypothetical protein
MIKRTKRQLEKDKGRSKHSKQEMKKKRMIIFNNEEDET